ncbi:hypothetical protein [Streptomyces sp. NPDC101393]|uniref:hypothetical protein n=1 Tax=Streptomyces sp. NPDC101393 TaxID=3366141 RepID=UPI0038070D21
MSPTCAASIARRAVDGTLSVPVATSIVVDAPTTVAANSVATAVPTNAGRWPRNAARANPLAMSTPFDHFRDPLVAPTRSVP